MEGRWSRGARKEHWGSWQAQCFLPLGCSTRVQAKTHLWWLAFAVACAPAATQQEHDPLRDATWQAPPPVQHWGVGGQLGAAAGRQLVGVEPPVQPVLPRRLQDAPGLVHGEGPLLHEDVAGGRQLPVGHLGDELPDQQLHVAPAVALELGRHGVGAQEGGDHRLGDGVRPLPEPPGNDLRSAFRTVGSNPSVRPGVTAIPGLFPRLSFWRRCARR